MDDAAPPPPPPKPRPRRFWKWVRRGAAVGLVGAGVLLAGLGGAWLWLRSESGNDWIAGKVESAVQGSMVGGSFHLGRLRTDLWNSVEVRDVALVAPDGHTVVGIASADVRVSLLPLLVKQARIPSATIDGVVFDLELSSDGTNDFGRMFGTSDAPSQPWNGLPVDLVIGVAKITNGKVRITRDGKPIVQADEVGISATVRTVGKVVSVSDVDVAAHFLVPDGSDLRVSGDVVWEGDRLSLVQVLAEGLGSKVAIEGTVTGLDGDDPVVDVHAATDPFDLAGLNPLIGDPGLKGRLDGAIDATGPLSALRVLATLDDRAGAGGVNVEALLDATADPITWSGTVTARQLHVDEIAPRQTRGKIPKQEPQLVLDGAIVIGGSGTAWPDGITATATFSGDHQDIYGIHLDALLAELSLDKGVLRLGPAHPVGPIADVEITGSLDLAHGPTELVVSGAFDPAELARFGATDLEGRGQVDVRVVGDLLATDPVWRVSGHVGIDDFSRTDDVRFDRIDADIRVAAGATTRVTGSATGRGGNTYGVALATFDEPALDVLVDAAGNVTVTGSGGVTGVAQGETLSVADAAGPWEVHVDPTGRAMVRADMTLGATQVSLLEGDRGRASVLVDPEKVDFQVRLDDGERAVVDTTGRLELGPQRVTLSSLTVEPVAGRTFSQERPVVLELTSGGITHADIALARLGGPGRVRITGTVGTEGPLDAQIGTTSLDLGLIAALFPDSAGHVTGTLDLDAHVTGDASDFRLQGTLATTGTFLKGIETPLGVRGSFASTPSGALGLDLRLASGPDRLGRVQGTVPLVPDLAALGVDAGGEVDVRVEVSPGPASRFGALYVMDWPTADLSGVLRATGPLRDPELELAAVVETPLDGWTRPARLEIDLHRDGDVLTVWGDILEGVTRRGSIDGAGTTRLGEVIASALGEGPEPDLSDYAVYLDDMDVGVELLAVPWQSLVALSGSSWAVDGRVAGSLHARGSANAPELSTSLWWTRTLVGGVEMTDGNLRVEPDDDELIVDLRGAFAGAGDLSVSGSVPFDLDFRREWTSWFPDDMVLVIDGSGIPIAALSAFDTDIVDASGLAVVRGTVTGRPSSPVPDVTLSLTDGALGYRGTGVLYDEIVIAARATPEAVYFDTFSLRTRPMAGVVKGFDVGGGGSMTFTGSVALETWTPREVTGQASFRRMVAVSLADMKARVSGELDVSGEWPAVQLRGDLVVDDAAIDRDEASFYEAGAFEVDEAIVIHRGTEPARARDDEEEDEPSLISYFDVDVAVDLGRDLELTVGFPVLDDLGEFGASITRADVVARVGGNVRFRMRDAAPELYGDVDVVSGKVRVVRANFDLTSGEVVFTGPPTNPRLDLAAEMTQGDTTIDLRLTGTAEKPEMSLSSATLQTGQIFAFLVTGQSPDTLSSGQGQAVQGAALGLLTQSLFGGAQVANFTIDPDGRVRFGVPPVNRNIVADVVFDPTPTLGDNVFELDGEVQLLKRLLLDFSVGDTKGDANLLFELRF